jgi:hypothetical protein
MQGPEPISLSIATCSGVEVETFGAIERQSAGTLSLSPLHASPRVFHFQVFRLIV